MSGPASESVLQAGREIAPHEFQCFCDRIRGRGSATPPLLLGVLAGLCDGAPAAAHTTLSLCRHAFGLGVSDLRDCVPKWVAGPGGNCCGLCVCLDLSLFCRAQSPRDVRASALVVAGGSEDGGDDAHGEDGGRDSPLYERQLVTEGLRGTTDTSRNHCSIRVAMTWLPSRRSSISMGGRIPLPWTTSPRAHAPFGVVPSFSGS